MLPQKRSQTEARKNVCKLAYDYLKENNLLFTLKDIIKEPTLDKAVNQLQELAFKEYISMPEYHLEELKDEDKVFISEMITTSQPIPINNYQSNENNDKLQLCIILYVS